MLASHSCSEVRPAARRRTERFLVIRLAGREFALRAGAIIGMLQMRGLPVQHFQGPPGWNQQVVLHGRLLPVFTPNQAAGVPDRPLSSRTALLLIESETDPNQPGFGIRVDSISRYEDIPSALVHTKAGVSKVRLDERWRPIINSTEIAVDFYAWSRERSATTS